MTARRALVLGVVLATTLLTASARPAHASRFMRTGIYDEAQTLYGPVDQTFATLAQLHVQEIRLNLYWGGKYGVAKKRPAHAVDPADSAYDWTLYDRTVTDATRYGIHVLFSLYGTPSWANGGKGPNVAPLKARDLRNFAFAAASRYSGSFMGPGGQVLPKVREWLAWNEPNNPVFLVPQYKRTASGWTLASPAAYAAICNAVYQGVHGTLLANERVACGGTAPRGNNNPKSARPSVSPLAFLRAVKVAGLKTFDAWAHHPYYSSPRDTPTTKPVTPNGAQVTSVTLGNLSVLINLVTQLYGNKRIWITEYGYQTNPPDHIVGVSWAKQALYLTQAFAIARANPRIDLMLWFLLRDDPNPEGWQSGLITSAGKHKPSFAAFQSLSP